VNGWARKSPMNFERKFSGDLPNYGKKRGGGNRKIEGEVQTSAASREEGGHEGREKAQH